MGNEAQRILDWGLSPKQRPNTFAQTHLSLSFFACGKAAGSYSYGCRCSFRVVRSDIRLRHPTQPTMKQQPIDSPVTFVAFRCSILREVPRPITAMG